MVNVCKLNPIILSVVNGVNIFKLNTLFLSHMKMIIVMLSVVLNVIILSVALVNVLKLNTDRFKVVILNDVI
jgi:hypothetical protein